MTKVHFEWDPKKDAENQRKHRVSFAVAQFAFADPCRVIAEDLVTAVRKHVTTVLVKLTAGFLRYDLPIGIM